MTVTLPQEKIQQLTLLEQNLGNILLQKKQLNMQIMEVNSALKELESSSESYQIIGNIMLKKDSQRVKEDLNSKKEHLELKIKTIEKQESTLKEKFKSLQEEITKDIGIKNE